MADLIVHHAVKPKPEESTNYDVDMLYEPVSGDEPMYYPYFEKQYRISILSTDLVVSSQNYTNTTFLTEWKFGTPRMVLDDPTNPQTTIRIIAEFNPTGSETVLVTSSGFIPSTYSSSFYELVKIDLFADAAYRGALLYGNAEGTYLPSSSCAIALMGDNATRNIYYEAVLINKSTAETITLERSSTYYTVYDSPFSSVLAIKRPSASRIIRGDNKGTVTMTETPESN